MNRFGNSPIIRDLIVHPPKLTECGISVIRRGSRNYTRRKGGKKDLASVTMESPIIGLNDYMCMKTIGTPVNSSGPLEAHRQG